MSMVAAPLWLLPLLAVQLFPVQVYGRNGCYKPVSPSARPAEVVVSPRPSNEGIPDNWDWRNIGGKSFVSNVLTQRNPKVCGSCWAEAATGAFSDRYKIATNGTLQVNLAVQILLNYDASMSGGTCFGGDDYLAARFFHTYGMSDDTCAPFAGVSYGWGFGCCDGDNKTTAWVRQHLCYACEWDSTCGWINDYRLYRASEYGTVRGEREMMAEIHERGSIACSVDSGPDAFDQYKGGIITSAMVPKPTGSTDHVIVLAGFGVDAETKTKFWVGRNSYGTRWGEGRGGGWFRLERGKNLLSMESSNCSWAVPHPVDVARIMREYSPGAAASALIV